MLKYTSDKKSVRTELETKIGLFIAKTILPKNISDFDHDINFKNMKYT